MSAARAGIGGHQPSKSNDQEVLILVVLVLFAGEGKSIMNTKAARFAYTIAIVGGAILWLATAVMSGRTEAWDASSYWTVAYPLAIALAGWLGYWFPEKPWRWGLAVMFAQAGVLVMSSSSFGLLPLGLILFGMLALPAIGLAQMAARLRLRNEG